MFKLYRFLSFIAIPLIFFNICWRIIQKKEDKQRYKERFGKSSIQIPQNKIIWIHAASVGEFKSSHIIIETYYKKYSILVTTTTKSAAEYASKYYAGKIIHQYAPFDVDIWVKRFIKYWKPQLVLWIESDLWPNTLSAIKKNKIQSLLINARISPQSFNRWKRIANNYNELLKTFSNVFAQSREDLKRLQSLTDKKIEFIGNLKLANVADTKNFPVLSKKSNLSIMLASSHKGEEEKLIPLIKKLYVKYSNTQFYLAPRHPERSSSIKKMFNHKKLKCTKESNLNYKNSRVIIVDSFGNLASYFHKSDIVFLGGSLSKSGGHNPIEPAKYNCAIISGNHVFNWQNIYDEMVKEQACYIINNLEKLEDLLEKLINDEDILEKSKQNALNFAQKKFFDEEKLIDIINNNLIKNV